MTYDFSLFLLFLLLLHLDQHLLLLGSLGLSLGLTFLQLPQLFLLLLTLFLTLLDVLAPHRLLFLLLLSQLFLRKRWRRVCSMVR